MKQRTSYDIGQPVKLIFSEDIVNILKVMSKNTWINYLPDTIVDLLSDDYFIALESIKYVPNVYFYLNDKLKNDRTVIKTTIKSFQKYNRIDEINIRFKPLKKRKLEVNE